MKKRGFALIEILTVITILAALAIIAFTSFDKTKVKSDQNRAIAYLRAIRSAEKLCWTSGCGTGTSKTYAALGNAAAINATLGVEIQLPNYTFSVASGTSTTFTATADTTGTTNDLTIDQDGNYTKGGAAFTPSY